jgi:hypothetical protein
MTQKQLSLRPELPIQTRDQIKAQTSKDLDRVGVVITNRATVETIRVDLEETGTTIAVVAGIIADASIRGQLNLQLVVLTRTLQFLSPQPKLV